MTNKTTEALKLAEEALERWREWDKWHSEGAWDNHDDEALAAIREAQAEQEKQEPVAWQFFEDGRWHNGSDYNCHRQNTEEAGYQIRELYAAPVSAEAIRAEALEEAAKVCDEPSYMQQRAKTSAECAAAIRGLK